MGDMVGFAFSDMSVTTWGTGEGPDCPQRWRARSGDLVAHFFADRDTPVEELYELGREALRTARADGQTDG